MSNTALKTTPQPRKKQKEQTALILFLCETMPQMFKYFRKKDGLSDRNALIVTKNFKNSNSFTEKRIMNQSYSSSAITRCYNYPLLLKKMTIQLSNSNIYLNPFKTTLSLRMIQKGKEMMKRVLKSIIPSKRQNTLSIPISGKEICERKSPSAVLEVISDTMSMTEEHQNLSHTNQARQILEAIKTTENKDTSVSRKLSPLAKFGLYIGAQRRKNGLSLQDFAQQANIPENLALQIELGIAPLEIVIESLAGISIAIKEDYKTVSKLLATPILKQM